MTYRTLYWGLLAYLLGDEESSLQGNKPDKWALKVAMNWSMYTADRSTHLKIMWVGFAAALLIAVMGISVQMLNLNVDIMTAQGPTVIKAGAPVMLTDRSHPVIR